MIAATNGLSFTVPFIFLIVSGFLVAVWVHVNEGRAESEFEAEFGPDWCEDGDAASSDVFGTERPMDSVGGRSVSLGSSVDSSPAGPADSADQPCPLDIRPFRPGGGPT